MSLSQTTSNPPPLAGIDEVSVPANAVIKFSYPAIADPLYIHSGATSIKWSYHLNTQTIPTISGEVVQVLSAMVGPITVTGQTAGLKTNQSGKLDPGTTPGWIDDKGLQAYGPNFELQDIVQWFRKYMTIAGTDNTGNAFRNERAITFTYPERGWSFQIMPTALTGFRYDKAVISPEWSITAEIVSDSALDYFAGVTMSSFTDDLLTTNTALQGQIGLSQFANTLTQTANPNFGQTGDFGSTNPFLNPLLGTSASQALKTMGDNFQGLVAAWSTGDFAHFGFGAALDTNALPKSIDQALSNTVLAGLPGWGGSTSTGGQTGSGTYTYTGSSTSDAIAVQIANAFSNQNVPPDLGIAVSLIESELDPNAANSSGHLGLFQNGITEGRATIPQAAIDLYNSQYKGGSTLPGLSNVYPVSTQVAQAAAWFNRDQPNGISNTTTNETDLLDWALSAQGVTLENNPLYKSFSKYLTQARTIIGQLSSGGGGSPPSGSASGLATQLLQQLGKGWSDDNGQGEAQLEKTANGQQLTNANGQKVSLKAATIATVLYLINQGWTVGTFAWCEDHSYDGSVSYAHAQGGAVDISSLKSPDGGNFYSIATDNSQVKKNVIAAATLLRNNDNPAQLISGGYGNHTDSNCIALCVTDPKGENPVSYYTQAVLNEHENHIHVGHS